MSRALRFDHVTHFVPDLEAATSAYRALGFPIERASARRTAVGLDRRGARRRYARHGRERAWLQRIVGDVRVVFVDGANENITTVLLDREGAPVDDVANLRFAAARDYPHAVARQGG